jgi:hypothetical protein
MKNGAGIDGNRWETNRRVAIANTYCLTVALDLFPPQGGRR